MDARVIGTWIDILIYFGGGVYATLLGFRVLGKNPGVDPKFDAAINKWGLVLRITGPLLILFGIVTILIRLPRS